MKKPLFRRIEEENGEIPDIWYYEELSHKIKFQIWQLISCAFQYEHSFDKICRSIVFNLRFEIGSNHLNNNCDRATYPFTEELKGFFFDGLYGKSDKINARYTLTALEKLCIQIIDADTIDIPYNKDNIFNMINYRLREERIGWQFNVDAQELIKIDSELTYKETIEPAFKLLHDAKFTESINDFTEAFRNYQSGTKQNMKDAIMYACKSLESTLKNICDKKKWKYDKKTTLQPLIKTVLDNNLLPKYNETFLNSLSNIFMGCGVIRNKEAGHGKSNVEAKETENIIDNDLVQFVLTQTASSIVYLIKSFNKIK